MESQVCRRIVSGRLLAGIAPLASLIVGASCGSVPGLRALPPPEIKIVETKPMRIDRIFTSMAGPYDRVDLDLSDLDWVTSFKSEVIDAVSGDRLGDEFFCHSQIQLENSTRLMVTATGSSEIRFPQGFAMPVKRILSLLPPEQRALSFLGMVLNNHDAKMDQMAKVRGRVEYFRDEDVGNPPRLKKLYKVGLTLDMDGTAGTDPSIEPVVDAEGVSMHCACVDGIKSHWYVPPGPQLTRKRYRGFLPVDAEVHYATAHLHNHGRYVLLRDVTTGQVMWRTDAEYEPNRVQLSKIPVYSNAQGFWMDRRHEYEIEAFYRNTTDHPVDAMAQIDLYYWPAGDVNITYPTGPH